MSTYMQPIRTRLYNALRWSERYTKTDMVYLFKGGTWSTIAQIGTAACTLALAMVVSRFVSKDAYGTYKYIFSIIAILSAFSLSGLSTAVFQSVARGFDGALQEGFWKNLRWSLFIFIGSLGLAIYYFALHNSTLAMGVLIGGCLLPFLASAKLAGSFLAAKKILTTVFTLVMGQRHPHCGAYRRYFYKHQSSMAGCRVCRRQHRQQPRYSRADA